MCWSSTHNRPSELPAVGPCASLHGCLRCCRFSTECITSECHRCCAPSFTAHASAHPTHLDLRLLPACCRAPEVLIDPFDPVVAQCWAPSGGPWAQCRMQLCKPVGVLRRLLFGPCARPIKVNCPFPAPPAQIAECNLAGLVEQGVPYRVESVAAKADGKRLSQEGLQEGLTVTFFP